MERSKRCFLFVLVFALSLTGSFTLSSNKAYAASEYDSVVEPVSSIYIQSQNASSEDYQQKDITTSYVSEVSSKNPTAAASFTSCVSDSSCHWIITQNTVDPSVTYDHIKKQTEIYYGITGTITFNSSSPNYAMVSTQNKIVIYMDRFGQTQIYYEPSAQTNVIIARINSVQNGTIDVSARPFVNTFPVVYPSGYQGALIPGALAQEPTDYAPRGSYHMEGLKLTGGWCVFDQPDCNLPIVNAPLILNWKIKDSDGNVITSATGQISEDRSVFTPELANFTYDFQQFGDYTIEAEWSVPIPYITPSDQTWNKTILKIRVDGSTYTSGFDQQDCDNKGVCSSKTVIECNSTTQTFYNYATCKYNELLNIGFLNPSINKFKNIFTAFIVPNNPSCSLALPNVAVTPSKNFPLSSYSAQMCSSSAQFRASFPIVPALLNFFFAISTFYLVARMINNLTDNGSHDVIVGAK